MVRKNDIDNFVKKKKANANDPEKYKRSGYRIGFDSRSEFFLQIEVITFTADMRWSVHIDNKNKNILVIGEWPTQGLQ